MRVNERTDERVAQYYTLQSVFLVVIDHSAWFCPTGAWRLEKEALTRSNRQLAQNADELTREIQRAETDKEELRKRLTEMEDELNRERYLQMRIPSNPAVALFKGLVNAS